MNDETPRLDGTDGLSMSMGPGNNSVVPHTIAIDDMRARDVFAMNNTSSDEVNEQRRAARKSRWSWPMQRPSHDEDDSPHPPILEVSSHPTDEPTGVSKRRKMVVAGMCIFLFLAVGVVVVVYILGRQGQPERSKLPPLGPCSLLQIDHGCAPGFCKGKDNCWCQPNDEQTDENRCARPLENIKMEFYMYRALGDSDNGTLMGLADSLEGVMWTLHSQVVTKSCPRALDITRVVRLKATVFNTDAPYEAWSGQFGPYADFSEGKCGGAGGGECVDNWKRYGFVVGCETWRPSMGGQSYGNKTQWYSLPGACPSQTFSDKTASCRRQEPGGQCAIPDGSSNCTWNLEEAGEVRLDNLTGVNDYKAFCASGGIEYDEQEDKGKGLTFWDNRFSTSANSARVDQLQQKFGEKYPNTELPEPTCDSQNAQCKYHDACDRLAGLCCPAGNGMFLSCCNAPSRLAGSLFPS